MLHPNYPHVFLEPATAAFPRAIIHTPEARVLLLSSLDTGLAVEPERFPRRFVLHRVSLVDEV